MISIIYRQKLLGMSLSNEITFYMKIAIDINKKVGGTRAYQAQSNNRDRFLVIRDLVDKNFHYIRAKLQERERKKGQDATVINSQIRQKIEEIYSQLERMREAVAAQKGARPQAQTIKYNLIQKLTSQTKDLQQLLDASTDLDRKLISRTKNQTYTQMRQQLLQPGKKNNRIISNQSRNDVPTQMQLQKMKQWQKVDEEIDRDIEQVLGGIKRWKQGLKITSQLNDQIDSKIGQLTNNVDKVNQDLFKSNKQLKGIVQKIRKPHKFCIDIVLILILIALIVAIVKLSSG